MRGLSSRLLLAFVMSLAGGCALNAKAQTPPACGCAFVKDKQPREVRVVFAGQSQPKPAEANMVVYTGDLIKVSPGVSATLVCDNVAGTVELRSTPRNQPVPCRNTPPEGILIGRGGRAIDSTTMADIPDVGYPVILSPRGTKLLNARPVLRWTSVTDASAYKVTVRGEEDSWSITVPAKTNSATQEIVYPGPCAPGRESGCAPPLKSGEIYKLVVEANGRSSEEEDLPNLGFTILSDDKVRELGSKERLVKQLAVEDSLKTYMIASLYANNDLNADAIKLLEADTGTAHNPEAVRLLGNLYLKIGLTRRAEALYLSLLTPALATQDTLAGKALTHQTLGEIYESLGNPREAIKYYVEAREAFSALNDREMADRVERRLSALRSP
jgi:hypothetical protein